MNAEFENLCISKNFISKTLVFRELLISKCTQVKKSQTQKNELYQAPILYHLMKYVHTDTNQSNFLLISVYKSYSVSDFEK